MDVVPIGEAHNTGVVPIGEVRRLMKEMAAPINEIVEKALQKQAEEMEKRYQDLLVERSEWHDEKKKLIEMLAPLEVWARIIHPDKSSAAYKKASNREAAWSVDGKYSICPTGVDTKNTEDTGTKNTGTKNAATKNAATKNAATKNAATETKHGSTNTPNSSPSFRYDRVFDHTSTNLDVYNALSVYVKHGIESKHLMLVMYGHSGTGKSQTLIHPYKAESASGNRGDHSPLISRILEKSFARIDGDGDVLAHITCLEYRSELFYNLALEKSKSMEFKPQTGKFKIKDKNEYFDPKGRIFTSAKEAIKHIQASDKHRGQGKTTENNSSSRGHAWYEVRMYRSSKKNDNDGQEQQMEEDTALGVYTFFDLGGLEPLQTKSDTGDGAKRESLSLTDALKALDEPLKAIAAGKSEWEAPVENKVRAVLCIPSSVSFLRFSCRFLD
jgi:hypothetical protein